jgi:hypothetical protein
MVEQECCDSAASRANPPMLRQMLLAGKTARCYRYNIDSLLAGHGGLVCHH